MTQEECSSFPQVSIRLSIRRHGRSRELLGNVSFPRVRILIDYQIFFEDMLIQPALVIGRLDIRFGLFVNQKIGRNRNKQGKITIEASIVGHGICGV